MLHLGPMGQETPHAVTPSRSSLWSVGNVIGWRCHSDCLDACDKQRSHGASRIALAKFMVGVGVAFPLKRPFRGGEHQQREVDSPDNPVHQATTYRR